MRVEIVALTARRTAVARKMLYRCFCGFVAEGEEDEFVAALTKHATEVHNMPLTPDQALAMAQPVIE